MDLVMILVAFAVALGLLGTSAVRWGMDSRDISTDPRIPGRFGILA